MKITEENNNYISVLSSDEIDSFNNILCICMEIMKMKTSDISFLPGGITNKNFLLTFKDGTRAVMRLAGKGVDESIGRSVERYNSIQVGTGLGIAPKVYFYDDNSGSQLTEFINMPTLHRKDFCENRAVLKNAAELLHMLHSGNIKFRGDFDPVKRIDNFVNRIEKSGFKERFTGFEDIYAMIHCVDDVLKKNPSVTAPLHCDLLAENFMFNGKEMKIIDWEFSGQGDPCYDVSGIMTENLLDTDACEDLLRFYFGREPYDKERARVYLNRILYCTYWSFYSLLQVAYGTNAEFFRQYGEDRAKLGIEYMRTIEQYLSVMRDQ